MAILHTVVFVLHLLEYQAHPSLKVLLVQHHNYSIVLNVQQDEKQKNEASKRALSLKI
jgi:hypothetical protein